MSPLGAAQRTGAPVSRRGAYRPYPLKGRSFSIALGSCIISFKQFVLNYYYYEYLKNTLRIGLVHI